MNITPLGMDQYIGEVMLLGERKENINDEGGGVLQMGNTWPILDSQEVPTLVSTTLGVGVGVVRNPRSGKISRIVKAPRKETKGIH
jgi:hypothetical protein